MERVQENIYLGQKIVFGRENQTVDIQRRLISMNVSSIWSGFTLDHKHESEYFERPFRVT